MLSKSTDSRADTSTAIFPPGTSGNRKWAVLFDVTTSAIQGDPLVDGFPAPEPGNFVKERRVALIPCAVRIWRRDRFSIHAGAGIAAEHERQHYRVRPIIGREPNGTAIPGPPAEGR